jgi:hypothetical protein
MGFLGLRARPQTHRILYFTSRSSEFGRISPRRNAPSTNEVLISILQVLRTQTVYLDRQHNWSIAVADTLRSVSDDVAEDLEHAFYDQGPRQDVRITRNMLETIDGLISLLRHRVQ